MAICFHKNYTKRIHQIEELFIQYNQYHNKNIIKNEFLSKSSNLCNRKFVNVGKIPIFSFGNYIIEQTYGMVYGLILNRTIVRSTGLRNRYLHFRDWIIDDETLHNMMIVNCNINMSFPGYVDTNITSYYNFIDKSNQILFDFALQELNPYKIFNVYSNASVMPSTQNVINLLYSHPIYYLSNFEVLGFAFNHIMKFSNEVIDYSKKSLHKILDFSPIGECSYRPKTTLISMHLRHQSINEKYTKKIDESYCELLRNSTRFINRNYQCFVLLASDRNVSISYMESCAETLNCTVVINHGIDELNEEESMFKELCHDDHCKEHGVWGFGINQIADLYFLSFGQRLLFYDVSTFGQVAGQLISFNQAVYQGNELDNFNILGEGSIRARYSYYDGVKLVDYKNLSRWKL